jgi:hypothetical protein
METITEAIKLLFKLALGICGLFGVIFIGTYVTEALKESSIPEGVSIFIGMLVVFLLFYLLDRPFLNKMEKERGKKQSEEEDFKERKIGQPAISDEDIVSDYADFIHENYRPDIIWDISKLPHPKERIVDALIKLNVKETTSDEKKKAIAVIFINLSQFQEGVGGKDLRMSRMEEISKLVEDNESGKINLTQYQSLMTEVIDGAEKEKLAYDKFNILVMKEMNETLPKKLIEGTARALSNK